MCEVVVVSIRLEHRHMPIGKRIARCHSRATHASGSQGQDEAKRGARNRTPEATKELAEDC